VSTIFDWSPIRSDRGHILRYYVIGQCSIQKLVVLGISLARMCSSIALFAHQNFDLMYIYWSISWRVGQTLSV